MSMLPAQLHLTLPVWTHELDLAGRDFAGDEAKVAFAIELSRRNVEARSGGPFGAAVFDGHDRVVAVGVRSEEHTSELQSLMRISYAVLCLKKKKQES